MIALRPPRLDTAAALEMLAAELALLRQMHALLNEEAHVLAPHAASDAQTASQAITDLAARRAQLARQLQAATLARSALLNPVAGNPPAAANAPAISTQVNLPDDPTLQRAWRGLRAAYVQIARRQQAHARTLERYGQYLQSRWNGLMQSAGQTRVYDRHGSAAPRQTRPATLVSA